MSETMGRAAGAAGKGAMADMAGNKNGSANVMDFLIGTILYESAAVV